MCSDPIPGSPGSKERARCPGLAAFDLDDIARREHCFIRRIESDHGSVANSTYVYCVFGVVPVATRGLGLYQQQSARRSKARLDFTQPLRCILQLRPTQPKQKTIIAVACDVVTMGAQAQQALYRDMSKIDNMFPAWFRNSIPCIRRSADEASTQLSGSANTLVMLAVRPVNCPLGASA